MRYVFENDVELQSRPSAERVVFFCSSCSCILNVSRQASRPDALIESLDNHCPGCGSALEGSVAARSMQVPREFATWRMDSPRAAARARRDHFQTAQSLRGFRFNFSPIDGLLEPMRQGWLMVMRGHASTTLAELLCFRAQLPTASGGMDSSVVFVDGGNCSDPYLYASFSRHAGIRQGKALRRVVTSRAFTIYQLADLIDGELPRVVADYGAKLVIVSDVLSMFQDPSVSDREARRVIDWISAGLRKVKTSGNDPPLVLATMGRRTQHDPRLLEKADVFLDIQPRGEGEVVAQLLKHPVNRWSRLVEFSLEEATGHRRHGARPMEARNIGKDNPVVQAGRLQ